MAKINKKFQLGQGVEVNIAINDNIAVSTSNYGKEMLKFFHQAKAKGKDVTFDYRRNAMIERFNEPIEEYEKKLEIDYNTAKEKQKEAKIWAKENIKK